MSNQSLKGILQQQKNQFPLIQEGNKMKNANKKCKDEGKILKGYLDKEQHYKGQQL